MKNAFRIAAVLSFNTAVVVIVSASSSVPSHASLPVGDDNGLFERKAYNRQGKFEKGIPNNAIAFIPRRSFSMIRKRNLVTSLAFFAGITDVIAHRRLHCNINMMTGNAIRFSKSIAELRFGDAIFYACLMTSYSAGFGLFRIRSLYAKQKLLLVAADGNSNNNSNSLSAGAAVHLILGAFAVYEALAAFLLRQVKSERWATPVLSVAYGVINAAGQDVNGGKPTHVATGHLANLGNCASDWVADSFFQLEGTKKKKERRKAVQRSIRVVSWLIMGVTSTAVVMNFMEQRDATLMHIPRDKSFRFLCLSPFGFLGLLYALLFSLVDRPPPEMLVTALGRLKKVSVHNTQYNKYAEGG